MVRNAPGSVVPQTREPRVRQNWIPACAGMTEWRMGILAMQVPPSVCVLVRFQDKDVSRHLVAAEAQCDNEKRIDNCTEGMIATVGAGRYIWLVPWDM